MSNASKTYRKKIQKVPYFIFFAYICVLWIISVNRSIEQYSGDKWIFIMLGVGGFVVLILYAIFDFGHKVFVDHVAMRITESIFNFTYSEINVKDIESIYYRADQFKASYKNTKKYQKRPSHAVEIKFEDGKILRKRWFIKEVDLFDLFLHIKKINNNVQFFTNDVENGPELAQYGEPFDKRGVHKWQENNVLFIFIFLFGLLLIFLWMVFLIKILN